MPPLTDPVILAQFQAVLANWNCTGYVTAKDVALAWIADELGGIIDQVKETRPEWDDWPFHYDFRLPIRGRELYIEVLLQDDDPKDPTIHIVSIHDV
jgi:hypothetical protein